MSDLYPGELMVIGFEGTEVTPALKEWITRRHAGGLVFFSRNLTSMAQACKFIAECQHLRSSVSSLPLFIAIDQEGGAVSRIVRGMTVLPGNMALGSIGSEDSAYAAGRIIAVEMGLMGFNVNFAPVADLSCNAQNQAVGVRSFGGDPEKVGRLACAFIEGLQSHGMMAVIKHFPGLGHCTADPHKDLPRVDEPEKELMEKDCVPFSMAVAAGVSMVMSAHAVYRCWEPKDPVPATLSRRVLHGILRQTMGFRGLVISDDLAMEAPSSHFSMQEIAVKAVRAGVNILLSCHSQDKQLALHRALESCVKAGGGEEQGIRESLQKMEQAKAKLKQNPYDGVADMATLGAHRQLADRMGRESITVYRNENGLVPLHLKKTQKIIVFVPRYESQTQVEDSALPSGGDVPVLLEMFKKQHGNTSLRAIDLSPSPRDFARLRECEDCDVAVLLTYNAHLHPKQMEFARKLLAHKKDVIVAAIRNPYDLEALKEARTALATYGFRNCSMGALIQVLFGDIEPAGRMPVHLNS